MTNCLCGVGFGRDMAERNGCDRWQNEGIAAYEGAIVRPRTGQSISIVSSGVAAVTKYASC